ncbi:MAG: hypothetical protein U5L96_06690 [Owenweeksia sp.]|nr:hypothetical protein [Owenweeksia sp.]
MSLNISEDDNTLDLDLAREVATYFRLKDNVAKQIIEETTRVVSNWRELAANYNIPRDEVELMAGAFATETP